MREFSRDNREEEVQFIDVTLADQDDEMESRWTQVFTQVIGSWYRIFFFLL